MEVQSALGIVIGRVRREKGLSQLLLSEKAALHLNTIQSIESGKYNIKVTTVFQIANGLGVSVSSLMEAVEEQPIDLPSDQY